MTERELILTRIITDTLLLLSEKEVDEEEILQGRTLSEYLRHGLDESDTIESGPSEEDKKRLSRMESSWSDYDWAISKLKQVWGMDV